LAIIKEVGRPQTATLFIRNISATDNPLSSNCGVRMSFIDTPLLQSYNNATFIRELVVIWSSAKESTHSFYAQSSFSKNSAWKN